MNRKKILDNLITTVLVACAIGMIFTLVKRGYFSPGHAGQPSAQQGSPGPGAGAAATKAAR